MGRSFVLEDNGSIQRSDYLITDQDEDALRDQGVCVTLAKVLLMLLNMLFMIGGAMIIYFASTTRKSGWIQVFKDGGFTFLTDTAFTFVLVLGVFVMAISFLGCFGAWLRNRLLLLVYGVFLALLVGFFLAVAVGVHSVASKTSSWEDKKFPADSNENIIGQSFNQIYCYAQVPQYCDDAPTLTACKQVAQYKDEYSTISEWTQDQCPRTVSIAKWCVKFLNSGQKGDVFQSSPYAQCRQSFLQFVTKYGNGAMVACIGVIAGMVLIVVFACVLRCRSKKKSLSRGSTTSSSSNDTKSYGYYGHQHHRTVDADDAYGHGSSEYHAYTAQHQSYEQQSYQPQQQQQQQQQPQYHYDDGHQYHHHQQEQQQYQYDDAYDHPYDNGQHYQQYQHQQEYTYQGQQDPYDYQYHQKRR